MIDNTKQILLDNLARQVLQGKMSFAEAAEICGDKHKLLLTLDGIKESI